VVFVDSLLRAESLGQVPPLNAGPHPVQNSVDHLTVIPPLAATAAAHRKERPQPFPFGIRQISPPHVHINDLWTK
jgi:hypothetical protein